MAVNPSVFNAAHVAAVIMAIETVTLKVRANTLKNGILMSVTTTLPVVLPINLMPLVGSMMVSQLAHIAALFLFSLVTMIDVLHTGHLRLVILFPFMLLFAFMANKICRHRAKFTLKKCY